ncbi:MAG: carboxypeptidase-like regulatory domain-containing protein, partial [Chitinophagaceae bacterium]
NVVTGQIIISGTVYDSTKLYVVPGVIVKSTGGGVTITDSSGAYHINTNEKDSISFYYANKPTQKFPVKSMASYNDFDISLQVRVFEKFKLLKEVKVFAKNYRQDSAENRLTYSKIFDYQKPGLRSNLTPGTPPGLDINELINIFRFRRNKMNLAFQKRLVENEEDKYVNYKFNSILLKRVTGLTGTLLDKYIMQYKPTYEFIVTATELEFYEYILSTANKFKKQEGLH